MKKYTEVVFLYEVKEPVVSSSGESHVTTVIIISDNYDIIQPKIFIEL